MSPTPPYAEDRYRPCVGIVLFDPKGRGVFMGERIDTPRAWQMPQGGIDPQEDIACAALRELKEETGIDPDYVKIIRTHPLPLFYDIPEDVLRARNFWGGQFVGQKQNWVAMRFSGEDHHIDLDAAPEQEREFKSWQWVPLSNTINLVVPFKRTVYEHVINAFADLATPEHTRKTYAPKIRTKKQP